MKILVIFFTKTVVYMIIRKIMSQRSKIKKEKQFNIPL